MVAEQAVTVVANAMTGTVATVASIAGSEAGGYAAGA
jgi:hypothetical protein